MTYVELKDWVLKSFGLNDSESLSLHVDPTEETLIICYNFTAEEIRYMISKKLNVNPMMFYETIMQSPVDKVFDFEETTFYNVVIPGDFWDGDDIKV